MSALEDTGYRGRRPFTAVFAAGGKPDELREIDGCYDGSFFGFDNRDRQSRVKIEEVFAEKTLVEVVVIEL